LRIKKSAENSSDGATPNTKAQVFEAAEKLFAEHGFQKVTVRDIAAEGGFNIASINYYFGSKTELANEIFRKRSSELNRERFTLLQSAMVENDDKPGVRAILQALFAPPLRWLHAEDRRRISIQVILRGRTEGTAEMRSALRKNVSHLDRFAIALKQACPHLPEREVYWRLHFCLAMVHNNRPAEFDRLCQLSRGVTAGVDAEELLNYMLDFAEAGFR
jgi:AcrR family transcriptional regulator